jgi:D-arabinose 1-dehydrogenase-like Zn-dependent alcohol dehydrogenase
MKTIITAGYFQCQFTARVRMNAVNVIVNLRDEAKHRVKVRNQTHIFHNAAVTPGTRIWQAHSEDVIIVYVPKRDNFKPVFAVLDAQRGRLHLYGGHRANQMLVVQEALVRTKQHRLVWANGGQIKPPLCPDPAAPIESKFGVQPFALKES